MSRPQLGRRSLEQDGRRIRTWIPQLVPLTTLLTSTSWDGDDKANTGGTLIDLSAVFSVPAGARAISVLISARADGAGAYFILSPLVAAVANACMVARPANGEADDASGIVPCDANGDVYYASNNCDQHTIIINGYFL